MKPILPLDKMTREEKLQTMDELWADLSRNEEEFESPAWHFQELAQRKKDLAEGKVHYHPFEDVVNRLRERCP